MTPDNSMGVLFVRLTRQRLAGRTALQPISIVSVTCTTYAGYSFRERIFLGTKPFCRESDIEWPMRRRRASVNALYVSFPCARDGFSAIGGQRKGMISATQNETDHASTALIVVFPSYRKADVRKPSWHEDVGLTRPIHLPLFLG